MNLFHQSNSIGDDNVANPTENVTHGPAGSLHRKEAGEVKLVKEFFHDLNASLNTGRLPVVGIFTLSFHLSAD